VDRDKAAPLIGGDLPEFERTLPAVRPDCTWANPGIVDQDVDATKPGPRRPGNLISGCVRCQIGLDREQFVGLALLTAAAASAYNGSRSRS
jgi:hypothetical protein